ncbi:hypothetical protein HU200_037441 [Digitaria exilis]|uniref:DUF4220 domain-containing protein n=1 Tax=Digitaria exilis TaxID=1010633 RepID=A0A835EK26_9POAL|nr:hypothetical protein HU200_037441 [Digitaria exilis]
MSYRRMGTMDQHLGKPMTTTLLHEPRDLWKSPRGTIIRIEAFTLVAIALSFFLAAFGSCRRWSNRWIIQKGFLVANAVFLSLGAYSTGLMQSSSVKSEMYPVWAVSLFSLLSCVDSITAYSLEFKSQLWKKVYQLCLYCGYVLLMSISTKSSGVCNIAVSVLSTITLMKGFHRTQALVVPGRMRSMIRVAKDQDHWRRNIRIYDAKLATETMLVVHLSLDHLEMRPIGGQDPKSEHSDSESKHSNWAHGFAFLEQINSRPNAVEEYKEVEADVDAYKDVCLALSLSHVLQGRLLWHNKRILEVRIEDCNDLLVSSWILLRRENDGVVDFEKAFKVVELELAFLYDILFTSNAFLHYYQAKAASVWEVASIIGVVFVGVAAVAIPSRTSGQQAGAVMETTTGDFIVTGVVVVSLALLQVLQLLRCWTSNWARVAFACDYVRNNNNQRLWNQIQQEVGASQMRLVARRNGIQKGIGGWQMRLRASLTRRSHWFHNYLWQNKIGQHSLVESVSTSRECNNKMYRKFKGWLSQAYSRVSRMLGFMYFEQMLHELLGSSHTGTAVELHADVKAAVADFIRQVIKSDGAGDWSRTFVGNRDEYSPSRYEMMMMINPGEPLDAKSYTSMILVWHIATCYCELVEQKEQYCTAKREVVEKDHRVATALSRYCAYLVASVPRLLPGNSVDTKDTHSRVAEKLGELLVMRGAEEDKLASMGRAIEMEAICSMEDHLHDLEKSRATEGEDLREIKDVLGALGGEGAQGTEEVLTGVRRKLDWICWLSRSWLKDCIDMQDTVGAVELRMEWQAVDMEKEREAVRQVKDELSAIARALESEVGALRRLMGELGRSETTCRGWESSQRLLAVPELLEEERQRVTQAMRGASDKLRLLKEERKSRGIRRCPKDNASPQDKILRSGLGLADRLQREPAPERWNLLKVFWVKALVYAAPSDDVEEHMQHLAQGGEFITHLWTLLYHHGVLSWQQGEDEDPESSSPRPQQPPKGTYVRMAALAGIPLDPPAFSRLHSGSEWNSYLTWDQEGEVQARFAGGHRQLLLLVLGDEDIEETHDVCSRSLM